jgi:hypothetical protein
MIIGENPIIRHRDHDLPPSAGVPIFHVRCAVTGLVEEREALFTS